jgi:hypothetical protein
VVWLKIGRVQKLLLFLLLKEDNPRGKRIPIWIAIHREFKIDYKPFFSKTKQKAFDEERKIRYAFERLVRQKFVLPVWSTLDGFSLVSLDGSECDFCILTDAGLLVAERLKRQEQFLKVDAEVAVRRVLDHLRSLGYVYVTAEQILEGLWVDSFCEFADRGMFDKYWNRAKLGLMLQKCGVDRDRISRLDGRRKYCLTQHQ